MRNKFHHLNDIHRSDGKRIKLPQINKSEKKIYFGITLCAHRAVR